MLRPAAMARREIMAAANEWRPRHRGQSALPAASLDSRNRHSSKGKSGGKGKGKDKGRGRGRF